jgi:hypothetical protein
MNKPFKVKESDEVDEIYARIARPHARDCEGDFCFDSDGIKVVGLDDPKEVNHVCDSVAETCGSVAGDIVRRVIEKAKK